MRRAALLLAAIFAAVGLSVPAASASRTMLIGFYDEGLGLYDPAESMPLLRQLHAQVLRVNLYWGGP